MTDEPKPAKARTKPRQTNGKEGKANAAQVEMRTAKIFELLCLGRKRREILQYVASKKLQQKGTKTAWNEIDWNIAERTVDEYIARANEEIKSLADIKKDYELGKALAQLNLLFQSDIKIQDYKAALAVVRERAALLGLHAPVKFAPTSPDGEQPFEQSQVIYYIPHNDRDPKK